jgi:Leucine-rich repeat (LRR) protein
MKKIILLIVFLPMIGFGQNVNIPDANFKAYLVGNSLINTNGDSEIQVSEATNFTGNITLFAGNPLYYPDLTGIEAFINLTSLECSGNYITSLDLSQNTELTMLNCGFNQLTMLDLSQNTKLVSLDFRFNQLTSIDLSSNTDLIYLNCYTNLLTSLNLSQNILLETLTCAFNQITSLNLSTNTDLNYLYCSDNLINSLDLSQNTKLEILNCEENKLYCLDLSNNTSLFNVNINNNVLEELNTKNGTWSTGNTIFSAYNNNLSCVEVDNIGYASTYWDFDNFTTLSTNCNYINNCNTTSLIEEHTSNKELLKVTNLLGRETSQTNQPLFYIYDDGSVEKKIIIE